MEKVGRRLKKKIVSVKYQKVYERHLNSQNMIKGLQIYATGGVKDQRNNSFPQKLNPQVISAEFRDIKQAPPLIQRMGEMDLKNLDPVKVKPVFKYTVRDFINWHLKDPRKKNLMKFAAWLKSIEPDRIIFQIQINVLLNPTYNDTSKGGVNIQKMLS